jgi:hypothetical protein
MNSRALRAGYSFHHRDFVEIGTLSRCHGEIRDSLPAFSPLGEQNNLGQLRLKSCFLNKMEGLV